MDICLASARLVSVLHATERCLSSTLYICTAPQKWEVVWRKQEWLLSCSTEEDLGPTWLLWGKTFGSRTQPPGQWKRKLTDIRKERKWRSTCLVSWFLLLKKGRRGMLQSFRSRVELSLPTQLPGFHFDQKMAWWPGGTTQRLWVLTPPESFQLGHSGLLQTELRKLKAGFVQSQ